MKPSQAVRALEWLRKSGVNVSSGSPYVYCLYSKHPIQTKDDFYSRLERAVGK